MIFFFFEKKKRKGKGCVERNGRNKNPIYPALVHSEYTAADAKATLLQLLDPFLDCVKEKKIDSLSSFLFLSEILNNQQRQAIAFTILGREEAAAHKFCYKHEIDGD